MAALDEQVVEEWLNRRGFFTIRGLKSGLGEIDLLAVQLRAREPPECWHVEVTISFNPIGYIGGGNSAKRRSSLDVEAGVREWVQKKFDDEAVVRRRDSLVSGATWTRVLVHGRVRHLTELPLFERHGVTLIPYREILEELLKDRKSTSSSSASGIADIVRYMRELV
jgi:hypothetical protein